MSEISDTHGEVPKDGVAGNREKRWDPQIDKPAATDSVGGYGSTGMKAMTGEAPEEEVGSDYQRMVTARQEFTKRAMEKYGLSPNDSRERLEVTGDYIPITATGGDNAEIVEVLLVGWTGKVANSQVVVRGDGTMYPFHSAMQTTNPWIGNSPITVEGVTGDLLAPDASPDTKLTLGAVLDYPGEGNDRYLGHVAKGNGYDPDGKKKAKHADGLEKSLKRFSR